MTQLAFVVGRIIYWEAISGNQCWNCLVYNLLHWHVTVHWLWLACHGVPMSRDKARFHWIIFRDHCCQLVPRWIFFPARLRKQPHGSEPWGQVLQTVPKLRPVPATSCLRYLATWRCPTCSYLTATCDYQRFFCGSARGTTTAPGALLIFGSISVIFFIFDVGSLLGSSYTQFY